MSTQDFPSRRLPTWLLWSMGCNIWSLGHRCCLAWESGDLQRHVWGLHLVEAFVTNGDGAYLVETFVTQGSYAYLVEVFVTQGSYAYLVEVFVTQGSYVCLVEGFVTKGSYACLVEPFVTQGVYALLDDTYVVEGAYAFSCHGLLAEILYARWWKASMPFLQCGWLAMIIRAHCLLTCLVISDTIAWNHSMVIVDTVSWKHNKERNAFKFDGQKT